MRRFVAILASAAIAAAAAAPTAVAEGSAGGANNIVLVSTTGDGASQARSALQAARFGGSSLTSTNLADAESHDCTGCRSVAVAVQAVFNSGDSTTFSPSNAAVAVNSNCFM